jgi:ATP-binding cassette subfamily B protein
MNETNGRGGNGRGGSSAGHGNGQRPAETADGQQPVKAPERPKYQPTGGPGARWGQRPVEKSINFWPSLRRLIGHLAPERMILVGVILLAITGIVMNVLGPRILGKATDVIFTGVIGKNLPGRSHQGSRSSRRSGPRVRAYADMVQRLNVVPGRHRLQPAGRYLMLALGPTCLGLFLWWQGCLLNGAVQRSIYTLRGEVEAKIHRLPLSRFDKQTRGELLSRVTNDIDNISQALQQTLSQLLTSLLTVIGVTVMMLIISPLLALIALVTIPVSIVVTGAIGKRSQKLFVQQWKSTGELNGHIEEAFTGQSLVKVFGRQREVDAVFGERNETVYKASFGAQFVSGIIMPTMFFIGNLNYVLIAVVGGLRVASGTMNLGDVQAFIQYTRMFTQPLTQLASMANLLQSGVASAERVFEVLDVEEQSPDAIGKLGPTRGLVEFEHISFSYETCQARGTTPLNPRKSMDSR